MKRQPKMHWLDTDASWAPFCGIGGPTLVTRSLDRVTCRVCMFRYLAQQAPWAAGFMLDLRAMDPKARTSEGARKKEVSSECTG